MGFEILSKLTFGEFDLQVVDITADVDAEVDRAENIDVVVKGHVRVMPSAESDHVVIHLHAQRIDVDLVLIDRDLGVDRVDAVLRLLVEKQQFGYLRERLSVQHNKVLAG